MKLPPNDLSPGPCPPRPTSTYTCEVTIVPRVYGGLEIEKVLIVLLIFEKIFPKITYLTPLSLSLSLSLYNS